MPRRGASSADAIISTAHTGTSVIISRREKSAPTGPATISTAMARRIRNSDAPTAGSSNSRLGRSFMGPLETLKFLLSGDYTGP
jgi:hypothetical protein